MTRKKGPWYLFGRYEQQTPELLKTFDNEADAITERDSYRWLMPRTWVVWVSEYSEYPIGERHQCEGPGEYRKGASAE